MMRATDRREFLKLCLASAPAAALLQHRKLLAQSTSAQSAASTLHFPATLGKYLDPLTIPAKLEPHGTRGDTTLYRIRMLEVEKRMHSQLPPTRVWAYEGHYPGPVIEAFRDRPVEIEWQNQLPLQHLFTVDAHIHGAMSPAPSVRTVPHLHGARTFSESDGMPEDWFPPGQSAVYTYPNPQRAAHLWFHDHAIGITRLNVYAGLTGTYLLRDDQELGMNLPNGPYEIPLLLQDRTLDEHGQLVYNPTMEDGVPLPPGVWGPEFFGELPAVNGTIYPFLEVEPRRYRFRVVNGANSRFFNLYLNLASHPTDVPALIDFHQIGSDGGLLANPVKLDKLLLSPGERADLIIDFTGLVGKTVTLSNSASVPYPGWGMMQSLHAPLSEIMQFRVSLPLKPGAKATSLPTKITLPRLTSEQAVKVRDFVLNERVDEKGISHGVRIDDKGYDDPVTAFPKLGTLEKWRFINTTDDAHPMHLHLVSFQVLERQGFNLPAFTAGKLVFEGEPRPPAANESGWKDVAIVTPREVLSLMVPFEGYAGRYVFHCHMLEHEDNDMMRPFVVVDPARAEKESAKSPPAHTHA